MKEQLVAALKSIHWSYAIFWSPSPQQSGVLEWGDGCYNGGIKTRRTIQSNSMDIIKANDQTVSQRSDQLRELYVSLLADDDNNDQNHRPLAALSPEDLTDVEWFYLTSMSYVFDIGQGLPGRCLLSGQTIWLSNSHRVDTNVFTRALLAKSGGIKTVVCFPFMDGVIELGATDLVEENLNIIQKIRAFLDKSPLLYPSFSQPVLGQDIELISPLGRSNCRPEMAQSLVDTYLLEGLGNNEDHPYGVSNHHEIISQDSHYQNVLSSLFKKSNQTFLQQENLEKKSGFLRWEKGVNDEKAELSEVNPQRLLKKILFKVPMMHNAHLMKCKEDSVQKDVLCKQEVLNTNHVLAERRRREKVNERFSILKSLIPSRSKADKVSILDDTITYLKELEKRVEELESCQELNTLDAITKNRRNAIEIKDGTSDNYDDNVNKRSNNKRIGSEATKGEQEVDQLSSKDSLINNTFITITISMVSKDISMNISCPWRGKLLLQIIDAMSNLHLDSQSIHSSTIDGILSLNIQSKAKGSITSASVDTITQTLLKVIRSSLNEKFSNASLE